ncbi:MAG: glycosyltransferase family 1 protein [Parcubacteria group bacterium]|jgi:glycosyltransferase involved in cell wall biosynthesis
MKIGIDVRCLIEGRRTGVEEYTLNLLKNLFKIDTKNEYVLFLNSFRAPKTDLSWIEEYPNVRIKRFMYPNKLLNFLFWYLRWPKIDKMLGGADIVFLPNIIFGSVSSDAKMLVTIHDLSFERYGETFSRKRRFWHMFINTKDICRRAAGIIAVSASTRSDLVSLYKIKAEKIDVVHSGIDEKFRPIDRNTTELIQIKEKYGLPYKFILYFGTIEPRKNLIGIIRAFNQLQSYALENNNEEMSRHSLVIAGQTGWLAGDIYAEINQSKFRDKIKIINSIPDADKEYIFNLASLFVYPSFFEGFGFPPLEAMRCGIPTIVSNNSSLPEIAGKGAVMVEPEKADELYAAMKEILLSKELQEMLRAEGIKKAESFKWKNTALEFLNIIKKLAKE